jgi:hypothetical protein
MSPATPGKSAKTAKSGKKRLKIHFAGICTFVWDKKNGTAEMRLVDLASAGYQQHYAALSIAITEDTPRTAIIGPDAEVAVSLPGVNSDVGVWNLIGTDVRFVGATGKLTVDDSKIDGGKKPVKTATSVRWLPNVGELTESDAANATCPIAAVIHIPAGHITADARVASRKVEFSNDGTPIGPSRYYASRFAVEMPFDTSIAVVLDRRRIIKFTESMEIVISNTCVCALGQEHAPDHFYAHYDVVDAKRRPTVKPAGTMPQTVFWPEFCIPAYVQM